MPPRTQSQLCIVLAGQSCPCCRILAAAVCRRQLESSRRAEFRRQLDQQSLANHYFGHTGPFFSVGSRTTGIPYWSLLGFRFLRKLQGPFQQTGPLSVWGWFPKGQGSVFSRRPGCGAGTRCLIQGISVGEARMTRRGDYLRSLYSCVAQEQSPTHIPCSRGVNSGNRLYVQVSYTTPSWPTSRWRGSTLPLPMCPRRTRRYNQTVGFAPRYSGPTRPPCCHQEREGQTTWPSSPPRVSR